MDVAPQDHPVLATLEDFALSLPETWVDTPWESRVVKVRTKIVLFSGGPGDDAPVISLKLPDSSDHALSLPGAYPTRYGLGKHGWVTIPLAGLAPEETEVLIDFVEESYRAVAPKALVKQLDQQSSTGGSG